MTRAQQIAERLRAHPLAGMQTRPKTDSRLRMRQVLEMRYLHEMTLEQCGEALGITRERVRQIEAKALRMIRANASLREKVRDMLAE